MNRRDIELLISARETTGRSFKAVVSNIEELNRKIDEQVAAAERGEGSLQDLKRTQDQLAQAGRDLSALQGQIDAYRRLSEQQDKNSAAAQKAAADFAAMKAELAGLETVTAAQERKLAGLEKKQRTTSAALDKTTTDLKAQTEVLERAGIEVAQLDTAQTAIVNSARQAGAGFVQLGTSIDAYSDNLRIARDAERSLAAQNAFDTKIAQARQLGDASRFVQLYADAAQTAKAADNQLAALTGFRAVGQMAVEASSDISRFVQAGQTMAVSSQQVAAGLRAIIDPAGEAMRTLDGVEAAIQQASAVAEAEKKSVGEYSNALNELSAASAALVRQGSLVDAFQKQEAATDAARAKFAQAQAEVQRLGQAMKAADAPTEELARDLRLAESALNEAGRALTVEETKLGEMSRALKAAGIDTNNLAAAQQRLQTAATQAAASTQKVNATLGRGGQKATGLFGLNPYELQNLGYQINDIFVGIASGQKPLTILTQQGLQISQLFPGLISGIAKFAARWFPLIAVITIAIGVIADYIGEAMKLKQAQEDLASLPTGELYKTDDLIKAQDALKKVAEDADTAREAMLSLAEEGFAPDKLVEYAEAAARLAERLGIDVKEATELLVSVQQGGIEAVFDLTEKTNDLTDADLAHAEALFDAGRAAEARQFVLDRVAERNAEIARATESVWTPAVNNLKSAWSSFTGFLQKVFAPVLDWLKQKVDNFILGFTYMTALLAGKGFDGAMEDARRVFNQQRGLTPQPGRGATDQQVRDRRFSRELDEEIDQTRELTAQERLRRAEIQARNRAQAAGVSKSLEDRAVQQAIAAEQRKINDETERAAKKGDAAGRRQQAAARRAQREAEAAQRKIQQAQDQLENQLRQLDSATGRGRSATLEQRLAVVQEKYEKIFDTIAKLRSLGITQSADGVSLDVVEQQVRASQELLKNEETIKFYEDQIALLTTQRKDEIEVITDAQTRGAKTVAQAYGEAEAVNARISPQIVDAAQKALDIARAIAGANPSPEMVSMIARLERIISGEPVNNIVNDVGTKALEGQEARLNNLLKERQDLVQSINTLNELGLISDAEARERTVAAYNSQATAIQPVLTQLRQTVELLHQQRDALTGLPLLSDAAYAAWLAKLEAVNAGLVATDDRLVQVQSAARQAIQQGVTQAFQTAADTIVGLIDGTLSFGDAIKNVFTTALSLVGQFLKAIADVLIQMIALQVAKKIIGSSFGVGFFHGGGVVGGGGGNVRKGNYGSWLGAPKFHGGGGLGLRPDEYKAVLKRGEEVLTEDDPRHIRNIGNDNGGGGRAPSLKQVLVLDPAEVAGAMQTRSGQRSILTTIRSNKETIKQMLK